jgi:hypothetical protein
MYKYLETCAIIENKKEKAKRRREEEKKSFHNKQLWRELRVINDPREEARRAQRETSESDN